MNKLANVVYAYSPKNDDELELKVGDKIEVIGIEEEGWWKGRLRGIVGVFPSNFVQVIESGSPDSTTRSSIINSSPQSNISSLPTSKLNLFGSKTPKTNQSLNDTLNNSNNNNNNIANNLIMNNTQHQQDNPGLISGDEQSITSSERRPKPIRGVGYGDIFAAGGVKPLSKPLPADPTINLASERLSTSSANALQKQIPKKPPPPTPTIENTNGTSTEQAPALPPKPANSFSPHLQHSRPLLSTAQQQQQPILPPHHHSQQPIQQVREQARVIYAYEPINEDELAMEVDDIIDIIDKDIEDAGWWKGKLRGKIGVFPDNFVQLIESPDLPSTEWQQLRANQTPTYQDKNTESKTKSVFAATPKGFSKELENNLEKHNNPGAFLSLQRNKFPLSGLTSAESTMNEDAKSGDISSSSETSPTKLNHITANRAKGPSRRPPSNILNKRNQFDQNKKETNGRDDTSLGGSRSMNSDAQTQAAHNALSSLPAGQHNATPTGGSNVSKPKEVAPTLAPVKSSLSLENVVDNLPLTPKTSQRATYQSSVVDASSAGLDKTKAMTANNTPGTPPWIIQLKKTQREKRDTPVANPTVASSQDDELVGSKATDTPSLVTSVLPPNDSTPQVEKKTTVQSLKGAYNPSSPLNTGAVKSLSSRYSGDFNSNIQNESHRNNANSSATNQESINNESSSVANRLSNILNKANSAKADFNPNHGLSANQATISNENGSSNNTNVPSNVTNKFSGVTANMGTQMHPNADNNNTNQTLNTTFGSSLVVNKTIKGEIDKTANDKPSKTIDSATGLSSAQFDNLLKQISKNVNSEMSQLREEVKRIREDMNGINENWGNVLGVIKTELKACQSATENQKRYIKELVNNLADERKKIAAMQTEIDRTLK